VDRDNLNSLYKFLENDFNPERYSDNFLDYESKQFFLREHFKSVQGFSKPSGTSSRPEIAIRDQARRDEVSNATQELARLPSVNRTAQNKKTRKKDKTLIFLIIFSVVLWWIIF